MIQSINKLKDIKHPLVSSLHMKKDFVHGHSEDVLVIETDFPDEEEDYLSFDSYLTTLLLDLKDLKSQAENRVGKFDRVDIRTH